MRTMNRTISDVAGLVVGGLVSMGLPFPVQAANVLSNVSIIAEGRLQATLGGWSDSAGRRVSAGLRMARGAMAYRFHVDAVDSTGHSAPAPTGWLITFRGGASALRPLLSLSATTLELHLPRPLGIRLEQADSIEIAATWPDSMASGVTLLVTMDFEPMDGGANRLAVVPVGVSAGATSSGAVQQWELTSAEGGRLLAIAGLPVEGLVSLSLEDEGGATLWTTVSSTFSAMSGVARLGVALQGGHHYRIVATFTAGYAASARTVVGMVLPAR